VELQDENERLRHSQAEAADQQAATAEILGIIRNSPTDAQRVFDAIAVNALRLCEARGAVVMRYDGALLHLVAHHNLNPEALERTKQRYPLIPDRRLPIGRAVLDAAVVQVTDLQTTVEFSGTVAREFGARGHVAIPLLHQGRAIGAIGISRPTLGPFSDRQIALLQTFADQAVIAIENVRLFKELQTSNRELTTALDKQTATSDILRVISSSPTNAQPVFDTIAQSAMRLCEAGMGVVTRYDGELLHLAAHTQVTTEGAEEARQMFPMRPGRSGVNARVILEGGVVHIYDAQADSDYSQSLSQALRLRSTVAVPMVRDGQVIGTVAVGRFELRPFSDKEIALLQTFADQAVIAIENVRLFTELQEKNRALTAAHVQVTESLEQQTATSEILSVISSSPTDAQPVFDTIVRNAVQLCEAMYGTVSLADGELIRLVAHSGLTVGQVEQLKATYPRAVIDHGAIPTAIRTGLIVRVADLDAEAHAVPADVAAHMRARGVRSVLVVPMLRQGQAIGSINVTHRDVGAFTDTHVDLLKTFADQAVIAIENVRLFKELQARTGELTRSVGELRALGEVSQALSSTLDVDVVLNTIVTRANDLIGADGCTIFEYDELTEQFHLRATRNLEPRLVELARGRPLRKGDQGILGQLPMGLQAVQVPDISAGSYSSPISDALIEAGYRAVVAVPLIREDHLIGALTMNRKTPGEFPAETIELLQTFATQSALAIQNARLFRELADKSRQLEVASQHKSEFLANMSHELRTPLNAVIGFSEVLSERMFGDLNEKQDEYLKDIHASGQHLLSLINDILDLSKIEAGKMDLEVSDFNLPATIDNALMLVRERAARRGIDLRKSVDERLGQVEADERKIRQVLLNLLSNAIKFTPEGGRIEVAAKPVDGSAEVSVRDTGVGIAPEDQEAIFEEFKQVGMASKKVEGTGLGLALSRKFIELHGGRIWVESQTGAGSTFTFTIPMRP
jgi:signal transduction histidine kinase